MEFINTVQNLLEQYPFWFNFLRTPEILRQVLLVVLLFILSWLVRGPIQRGVAWGKAKAGPWTWSHRPLDVLAQVVFPLITWLLIELAISGFEDVSWGTTFLGWASSAILLWLLYVLAQALLGVSLSPAQVRLWSRKVILPLILLIGLLQVFGLLDDVLETSLVPSQLEVHITIGSALSGLVILLVFFSAARGIQQYLEQIFLPQASFGRAFSQAVSTIIFYVLISVGVLVGLYYTGIDLSALTIVAGGLSVGIGFGLREIASNFVSGFILMFDRSIGAGDVVQVDDITGRVDRIGVRGMLIRTLDNVELIVPNAKFLSEPVTNLTRTESRIRIRINVGVSYDSDPNQVREVLLSAADHENTLRFPKPNVQFTGFGDNSLNFALLVWLDDPERTSNISSDLRFKVWYALKEQGIEMPFPQRDLHIRSDFRVDSPPADQI